MNKLVYIYVQKKCVIGQVVLKLLSKRLAVRSYGKQDSNEKQCVLASPCMACMNMEGIRDRNSMGMLYESPRIK
jgi:hypothetical protein